MGIKLLAVDVDGTLLTSEQTISPATRQAIDEIRRRGILLVLVTGRRFALARPIALELGLTTPLITHSGALIKDVHTSDVIAVDLLRADLARRVIECARRSDVDIVCCDDPWGMGTTVIDRISAENVSLRRYLERLPDVITVTPDLLSYVDHDIINLMTIDRPPVMEEFARTLQTTFGSQVKVLKTVYPERGMTVVDVLSPTCSKARALERVVRGYGFSPAEVMAVGDNQNDLDMLEYAGVSVVMGNAEPGLKTLGYPPTRSNDEDGLAEAIDRFLLGRA
jgi:Cof subfamily protein (haloacid dehalogenase superfamily)